MNLGKNVLQLLKKVTTITCIYNNCKKTLTFYLLSCNENIRYLAVSMGIGIRKYLLYLLAFY